MLTVKTAPVKFRLGDPGLAKFGIALDLGSRDRGFESRSPDHQTMEVIHIYPFYSYVISPKLSPPFLLSLVWSPWSSPYGSVPQRSVGWAHNP